MTAKLTNEERMSRCSEFRYSDEERDALREAIKLLLLPGYKILTQNEEAHLNRYHHRECPGCRKGKRFAQW